MAITTRIVAIDPLAPDDAILEEAADILRSGGLVAFPTETVYGLGAVATDPSAVARIFEAKGRPSYNPLIVHADGPERVSPCVADWPSSAQRLAAQFWPGPLTLVLPRSDKIPDLVTAGQQTVAIRVPESLIARTLIARLGLPIAAPSANRSNGISPTLARHVAKDLDGRIELILDGGPTALGLESTVLDLTTPTPQLLRPGAITIDQIRNALGGHRIRESAGEASSDRPKSPGQLATHYAPKLPTLRIQAEDLDRFEWPGAAVLILLGDHPASQALPPHVQPVCLSTPASAATSFYAALHAADESSASLIVIVPPPDRVEWQALRDRLWRASRPWPV